jgi:pyridoxal phosphate enzyme (YggS family)
MSAARDIIARNLAGVRAQVAAACARCERDPQQVRLVAVTKYAEWNWVRALVDLGVTDLGESRTRQLADRRARLGSELPEHAVRWHLIGHLQSNKVPEALSAADVIQSVDSLKLLRKLDQSVLSAELRRPLLLQVNITGESTKQGFAPHELRNCWREITACRNLAVTGLMTMAAETTNPEETRPVFQALAELRTDLSAQPESPSLFELSMGMSGDFEVAVEEGATLIRIGSKLFEGCAATVAVPGR